MKANKYQRIEEARIILGLGGDATRKEIRDAFRELSQKYHPDHCPQEELTTCRAKFEKIVRAREVLERYCENYRYSFREEEIRLQPDSGEIADHLDRFYGNYAI